MWGWLRRSGDPVVHRVPAVEPSASERVDDEARIERLNAEIWEAFRDGDKARADRLIDMRLAIRPAQESEVPVVPGRVEASAENYQENPW